MDAKDVIVEASLKGEKKTAKATFTVKRPRMDSFASETTKAKPAIAIRGDSLRFGELGGSEGIKWTGKVTTPSDGKGMIAFLQLVKSEMVWIEAGKKGRKAYANTLGGFMLDRNFVKKDIVFYGAITAIGADKTEPHVSTDSPGTETGADWREISREDQFQIYLMYQPSAGDAKQNIWVTLGKLDWNWRGTAIKDGNQWSVKGKDDDYTPNPEGKGSVSLPTWLWTFQDFLRLDQ